MLSLMERSDVDLVLAARNSDAQAFGDLFERWYDRVYDVARNIVRDSEIAAEVAQDVFLAVYQRLDQLEDPSKFGGWALRISRNRALNRLEKEKRSLSFESETMTGLHEQAHGSAGDRDDLVGSNRLLETDSISEVRDRQDLLWAATAALGERDASLVDLVLRHQLTPAEIADELDVTANNAHQLLFRLRNKVGDAVANHLVWRNGRPRCGELQALLGAESTFDAKVNKAVQKHAASCAVCGEEREKVVDPQKLFAAVPVAVAPALLKAEGVAALAAQGVPIDPARFAPKPNADAGAASNSSGSSTGGSSGGGSGAGGSGGGAGRGGSGRSGDAFAAVESSHRRHRKPRRSRAARLARRAGFVTAGVAVLVGVLLAFDRPVGDSVQVAAPASTTEEPATATTSEAAPRTTPSTTVATTPSTTVATTPSTTAPPRTTPSTTEPAPEPDPPADPDPPTDDGGDSTPPTVTVTLTVVTLDPSFAIPTPLPSIVRFTSRPATAVAVGCPEFESLTQFAWVTDNAESVELSVGGDLTTGEPSGAATVCVGLADIVTLTAVGPGGSVSETL